MLKVKLDKQFKKDIKRDKHSGKFKENDFLILKEVMSNIIDKQKIDEKYFEHKLIGNFKDYQECHLKPNWLLIYKTDKEFARFARLGTHQQIFKKY